YGRRRRAPRPGRRPYDVLQDAYARAFEHLDQFAVLFTTCIWGRSHVPVCRNCELADSSEQTSWQQTFYTSFLCAGHLGRVRLEPGNVRRPESTITRTEKVAAAQW